MSLDFLYQDYNRLHAEFVQLNHKLAHYTQFENALKILQGQSLWLKSADQMTDRYELHYGKTLIKNFADTRKEILKLISEQTSLNLLNLLSFANEEYWKKIFFNTFLASFVEHSPDDDEVGRADMWERYAKPEGIAFVLRPNFLESDDNVPGLFPLPVRYFNQEKLNQFLDNIARELHSVSASEIILREKSEIAFQLVCLIASIKRPAFRAETEWRLVANSLVEEFGNHISQKNMPRRVELDLSNRSASSYGIANSLERIIVGPGQNQLTHVKAISMALDKLDLNSVPVVLSSI